MGFNKKFFTTGGIVASTPSAAAFDPLQNFETVTYTGNGSTQKITGYIRKGAAFNGSSSKIVPATTPIPISGAFTVSAWVKTSSSNSCFISFGDFWLKSEYLSGVFSLGDLNTSFQGTTDISDGNWHHCVLTVDASNNIVLYVDGNPEDTGASTINRTNGGSFAIGVARTSNPVYYWNGNIDQVRIFNRALLEDNNGVDEIQALADETYADPKKSTTDYFGDGSGVALYELDEDANSSNFEQAAVFNGSSSYVSLPFNLHNTAFSISFWAINTLDSTNNYIIANNSGSTQAGWHIGGTNGGGTKYNFRINNGASNYLLLDSATVDDTNWHHVVVTWDNTTNANGAKIYINGSLSSQGTSTATTSFSFTNSTTQLMREPSGSLRSDGKLDQLRIYSSALDSTDVEKLYKESADVPTANLVAHYKLDGNATDETETYDGTASNVTYSAGVYGGTPTNVNFLGMAFQPDFVWIKQRTGGGNNSLFDSIRGIEKYLISNSTIQETDFSGVNGLISFDANGFTVDDTGGLDYSVNHSGDYVAWCWKAGGAVTPNNNTNGNVPTTVSANVDAGFSIVKYFGGNISNTYGHGLDSAPELIIIKNLDTVRDWSVVGTGLGGDGGDRLVLNDTVAKITTTGLSGTTPTTFAFEHNNSIANSAENFIAYCFHSVVGYQKVGSYLGNGGTQSITLGFSPRFVMWKATNNAENWYIMDSVRGENNVLYADGSFAEGGSAGVSFTSTGFTLTGSFNASSRNYIYLAIA